MKSVQREALSQKLDGFQPLKCVEGMGALALMLKNNGALALNTQKYGSSRFKRSKVWELLL